MGEMQNLSSWVVTEGIAGTENQCLGIAQALNLTPKVRKVYLNTPWKELSPYIGFECSATFDPPLQSPWPDIAILGGRKSIAAARYIKKQSRGKTFTIFLQNPRVNPNEFDVVIAPQHDNIEGDNVFKTLAAPNLITPQSLTAAKEKFPGLSRLKAPIITVLIGGNSQSQTLTLDRTKEIIEQLLSLGGTLLVTASRRTDVVCKNYLNSKFKFTDHFYWDGHGENPYQSMLASADYICVTNDSASMLSESATTGKPVYILPIDGHNNRVLNLQNALIKTGRVRLFDGALEKWSYDPLNDAQEAADFIRERLYTHFA